MFQAQRVQLVLLRVVPEGAKLAGELRQATGQRFVEKLVIAWQRSNSMRGHCVGYLQNDRCLPRLRSAGVRRNLPGHAVGPQCLSDVMSASRTMGRCI